MARRPPSPRSTHPTALWRIRSAPSRCGREAIEAFYGPLAAARVTTDLLAVRAAAGSAAFSFRVTTHAGDRQYVVEPIDVMTFDEAGQITSMRAFWAPEDMLVQPAPA